jgi:hypothetical protein
MLAYRDDNAVHGMCKILFQPLHIYVVSLEKARQNGFDRGGGTAQSGDDGLEFGSDAAQEPLPSILRLAQVVHERRYIRP